MRKLISANFHRLYKDRFSWCVAGLVVILSLGNILNSARNYEDLLASGYITTLDDYYFNQAQLIGMFLALFVSSFMGTEFSDGTIRNKLCIGHKRSQILLANFISCSLAALLLVSVWLMVSALGFVLIGPLEMSTSVFIAHIVVALGFAVAFSAFYTVIGSLSSNKAMTIIYTFGIFLLLAIAAAGFYDRLCEPEMNTGMMLVGKELVEMEPIPNPLYLSGKIRTMWECAMEFLPTGQALLLSDASIEYPVRALLFSVAFTGLTLLVGSVLFRRKDIK